MLSRLQSGAFVRGAFAVLATTLVSTVVLAQDPEPFRGDDEISGRDDRFRKTVFMNWFTFRPRLGQRLEWDRTREGFFGTAGSISADELYFHEELHKRFPLGSAMFAAFRHKADEDFDGAYTRTLTGIGAGFGDGWTATLFGDVGREKAYIDTSVELEWRGERSNRFRFAVVATDALHGQKADMEEYTQYPLTVFSEYRVALDRGGVCGAWVNWNTPLELQLLEDELEFAYEQMTFGARGVFPFGDTAHVMAEGGTENGTRRWREPSDFVIGARDLDRTHANLNVETEWELTRTMRMWIGYRYFALTELYTDDLTPEGNGKIDRNENMLHAGVKWQIRDNIFLWPGLYVNQVDLQDHFPSDEERSWDSEGLVGKLTVPLELSLANGATITVNMSFRTDILRSGGYNVQFYIPL